MDARNPAYNQNGTIDLEIQHPRFGWIPFTADPNDSEPVGRDLYAKALAGDFGSIAVYVAPPPPTAAELLEAEREAMVCSRFQAKAALAAAGLLTAAEAAVAQADQIAQLAWSDAVEFRRNSPTILTLAPALSLTDEQIDDLFRAAMAIEA